MRGIASSFPRSLLGLAASALHTERNPCRHARSSVPNKKNQNRQISAASLRAVPPRISSSSPLPAASSTVAYPIGGHRRMLRAVKPLPPPVLHTLHCLEVFFFFFKLHASISCSPAAASPWIRFDTSSSSSPEHYSMGAFSF